LHLLAASAPFCDHFSPYYLFSNRSAAFLKMEINQPAKLDAKQELRYTPNDKKAQLRLATALFHLGSDKNASM
jgi:hypothetical protein